MPSCDRRAQVVACVESLLRQSLAPAEIVVVDDHSRDGTAEAILAIAPSAGGTSLRVVRNGRNLGANASRNVGVAASSGALVAFLDSDCEASPTWLENIVRPFGDPSVGAVSGLVEDTCRDNAWERAFAGTHRLPRRGPTSRFTSCNLCVRRTLLSAHRWEEDFSDATRSGVAPPDTSFSGRCDEEGLYLAIRAAGWAVLAEPSAVLRHHHPYSARSFMRQAYHGGRAAAELVWKFRLHDRLDVAPFLLALLAAVAAVPIACTAGAPWSRWALLVPLLPLGAGVAAVAWNETARKGKTPLGLLRAAPALILYYALRCTGYAV
ncbi:MAG: glycosyltransferase, partial [Proteobacteria bacterium]|nr:glycosyltransferase [Pseudomonadota bacterium]